METIVHRNLRPEKSVKKVEKSSFKQKRNIQFHHLQLCLWKATLSDNLIRVFYPFNKLFEEVQYWRLSLLMLNDSGEKKYRRNFAKIVAIRGLSIFFQDMGRNLSPEIF